MSRHLLPSLRARMSKFPATSKRGERRDIPTQKEIFDRAKMAWSDLRPLMAADYENVLSSGQRIGQLAHLLDKIESGLVRMENRRWVDEDEPTGRPDQVHRIALLNNGRPVIRVAAAPQQAIGLRNVFKRAVK